MKYWDDNMKRIVLLFLAAATFLAMTACGNANCTSGGSSIAQSISDIKKEVPQAKILNGLRISDKKDIIPWLKQLGMPFKEGA